MSNDQWHTQAEEPARWAPGSQYQAQTWGSGYEPGIGPTLGTTSQATPPPLKNSDGGFFSALFDFSFERYATPHIVRFTFVLVVIVAILLWVAQVLCGLLFDRQVSRLLALVGERGSAGHWGFFLGLLLGWIRPFLLIIGWRLRLELALATVRTAENTGAMRRHLGA